MNMASVMKLVTTLAALDLLGPAFTFHTDVFIRGELANGVLEGDLVIRGGGDPHLTYDRVWQLAHQLRARGLREIRGDIVVDRSYFAPIVHDPARFDREPRRAYNVGPDALLVNFQALDFRFIPEGNRVRVVAEPDLPNVEIASELHVTQEPCTWWRGQIRPDVVENGLIATVMFSGSYPAACGEHSWPLAVFDGPRFTESVIRWLWSEAGGTLRGKVRAGALPAQAKLFYRHDSEPLANLLRDMNKFSNNVMARQVFLALSAEKTTAAGEARASERVVREWLGARGIPAPELVLDNGSGLSREQRASAATIAAVLKTAWAGPAMPEFVASLPILGADGTFESHKGTDASGYAHLKGGTLDDVQTVAGYVLDTAGKRWVVVMAMNHPKANGARGAIDALVEWVHDRGAPRRSR
jgi:D-alanyl-D-alanine carboxypeptidase/D-alanyl-D-alanine-endopeptidase (penicillin-binding protein 4)